MSSNLERQPDSGPEIERYRVLLELADLMVHRPTLPELFHELAQTLQKAISFDFINFSLYDPTTNAMRLRLWEGGAAPLVPSEVPVDDSASGWVWQGPGGEYRMLRAGDNGWTCLPTFPGVPHDEPMCLDGVFLQFFKDAIAHRPLHVDRVGLSYMYTGGWVPNAPHTNAAPDDYHVGPHIMVVVPNGAGLSDYTANPRSSGAYINRVHGTDIPYLVIPLHATP